MSKSTAFARYSLILEKLRTKPSTFNEIADYLEFQSELKQEKYTVSKRTFQRDIEDISLSFGVEIEYDFSQKVYRIAFDENNEQGARILEAFDTMNALRLNEKLTDYVHFEQRKSKGTEHLYGILHCIRNGYEFEFIYHKFLDDEISKRTLKPYALKEFKHRWYVVGLDSKSNEIRIFGLDRILSIDILKTKFKYPKDFNVNQYFKYSFGIIRPLDEQPEKIILSFTPSHGKYVKTTPLHHSQKVIVDNEIEVQIELELFITYDFVMEIMQYSRDMKVIQPECLKQELQDLHSAAL